MKSTLPMGLERVSFANSMIFFPNFLLQTFQWLFHN
jgi:hypothetical protein